MKVFGFAGWSGSGKTTLVIKVIPALIQRGLSVSTIKHTHHNVDIDRPGKDSYEHRVAGAYEVLITGANRWALLHENRGEPEPDIDTMLGHMSAVDLVLIEGFKSYPHPKLEVYRPSIGKPLLANQDANVVAVASDEAVPGLSVPLLRLGDIDGVADFITGYLGFGRAVVHGAA
ncbi:MAG: molybdopterin-guanine dinucleotide biosynthesis protein B [Proteobacteria bacterium]|nr:molybdopterin-guanine dinucleotide biosynthesis protein B [Pseudomonadota bacterium]